MWVAGGEALKRTRTNKQGDEINTRLWRNATLFAPIRIVGFLKSFCVCFYSCCFSNRRVEQRSSFQWTVVAKFWNHLSSAASDEPARSPAPMDVLLDLVRVWRGAQTRWWSRGSASQRQQLTFLLSILILESHSCSQILAVFCCCFFVFKNTGHFKIPSADNDSLACSLLFDFILCLRWPSCVPLSVLSKAEPSLPLTDFVSSFAWAD